MKKELVVLVTMPAREQSEEIASRLVEEHLAACVNIVGPVCSIYRWNGKLSRDEEYLLVIKSTGGRYAELEGRLRVLHPYSTPEVIALPISAGSEDYLRWLRAETTPPAPS